MEVLNFVRMTKMINFSHFEAYVGSMFKTAGFGHNSPLSPGWSLPTANSKLTASGQHNRQQATGNRQQATGNRQQATGNRQLYTSSCKPCQQTNSKYPILFVVIFIFVRFSSHYFRYFYGGLHIN